MSGFWEGVAVALGAVGCVTAVVGLLIGCLVLRYRRL